jgi:hypothetical protein
MHEWCEPWDGRPAFVNLICEKIQETPARLNGHNTHLVNRTGMSVLGEISAGD